jgi:membrane-associated phospholipid phosphatase
VIVLVAYDVVLVAAILLLEMHYVIDILVGLVVAALAITISGRTPGHARVGKRKPRASSSATLHCG